jgi:serine/threonine-protein kinase
MQVPQWLLAIVAKCLEKDPQKRFANGMELHEAVVTNSILALHIADDNTMVLQAENERLRRQLHRSKDISAAREREVIALKEQLAQAEQTVVHHAQPVTRVTEPHDNNTVRLSKTVLFALIFLLVGLGAVAAYSLFSKKGDGDTNLVAGTDTSTVAIDTTTGNVTSEVEKKDEKKEKKRITDSTNAEIRAANELAQKQIEASEQQTQVNTPDNRNTEPENTEEKPKTEEKPSSDNNNTGTKYTLAVTKAYFHNEPDESTRRAAFINIWNKAILTPTEERNGFVYIVFTNHQGQTSRGWMRKKDLKPVSE